MKNTKERILKDLKSSRVVVSFNTGTRVHKAKKGKGSYTRKVKHPTPWERYHED